MRIKSYFDSSIQTAMRQARQEFGEDVMLVTSRIASPELRYLGNFEVVFAVDERETEPKAENLPQPEPPATGFEEILRQLASPAVPAEGALEAAIDAIHSLLVDIGLEATMAEAMIALIRSYPLHSREQPGSVRVPQEPPRLAAAQESAGKHMPAPLPEPLPSCDPSAVLTGPFPDRSGTAPVGPCASEETSILANPSSPACVDCETKPDMEIGETGMQTSSREMPRGERANPVVAVHEPRRAPRTSGFHPLSGLTMMLVAFGVYGMIRRSG